LCSRAVGPAIPLGETTWGRARLSAHAAAKIILDD